MKRTRITHITALAGLAAAAFATTATADDGACHAEMSALLPTGCEVYLSSGMDLQNTPTFDRWETSDGAYDSSLAGPAPAQTSMPDMSNVVAPVLLGAFRKEVILGNKSGNTTISTDISCEQFIVSGNRTITIQGDVVIYASELFKIENYAKVELAEGASLTVYVANEVVVENHAHINMNTWDPTKMIFVNVGSSEFILKNNSHVCGSIISPMGGALMENNGDVYGWYAGDHLTLRNTAGLHVPNGLFSVPGTRTISVPVNPDLHD